jgi:hypothetical protein
MPRYFINGKTYNIPDDKAEDFLSKNQDATEIEPIADWKTDTEKYAQQVKKRVEAGYADATGETEVYAQEATNQLKNQLDNTEAAQSIAQANDLSGVGLSNPNQGAFGQTSQYFNPLPKTGRELNMPSYESENYEANLDDILENDLGYDEKGVKDVKWALGVMKETALTKEQKNNVVKKADELFSTNQETGTLEVTNLNPEGLLTQEDLDMQAKIGVSATSGIVPGGSLFQDAKASVVSFFSELYERKIGDEKIGDKKLLNEEDQTKITTQLDFLKEAKENLDAQVKNGNIKEYDQQDVISTAKQLYSKDLTTTANSENIDKYIKDNFNTKEITRDGKKIEIEKGIFDTARSEIQLKLDKITDLYVEKTSTYGEKLIANTNGVMVRLEELNKSAEVLISNAKKNPPKTAEELDVLYNELEKINKEKNQQIAVGERNTAKLDYLAIDEEKLGRFGDLIGRNYNGIAKFAGLASSSAIDMGLGIEEYANSVALNLTPARLFENIVLPATKWVGDDAQVQKAMQINQALKMLPPAPVGIPGVPLSAIQSKAYQDYRKTIVDSVDAFSEDLRENVAKPMNYSDIKSASDWGQWALDFSAQQGPQIGLMVAAPQIALPLLSMSSGGSKIRGMRKEVAQGLENYSEAQIMAAGTLTGIGEYVSERLTLGQLKRLRLKNINVNVAKEGFRSRLSSTLFNPNRIKATIYDVNEEGVGEMFAKFTENLADKYIGGKKDVGIWDGMEEAYVGGVFMSGVLFRAPSIGSQIMAPFKTKSLDLKFEENANNINKLANELNKGINPETRTIIENKIGSLVSANAELRVDQAMSTDYLSQDQKNNLINIHKQVNTNNIEIEALKKDKSIKPEVKAGLITSIEIENARLQKGQEAIMDPAIEAHYNETYKNVEGIVSKMEGVTIKEMTTAEIKAENIKRGQSNDKKASLIESGKETAQELINENNPGTFNKLTGEIIINKEAALANKQVNVAAHELLHGVMNQTFKNNPAAQKEFGKGVLAELSKIKGIEGTNLFSRIDQYQKAADAGKMSQEDAYEEAMNLLGDAIATKDVKIPETVLTKIGKFITDTVGKAFPSWKTKFSKGSDVVNFIQNFQKEVGQGELSAETKTITEQGAKGRLAKVKPAKAKPKTVTKSSLPTIKGVKPTQVKDMVGKVANRAVTKYFRGIPRNIREKAGLDRATYLDSAKTELAEIAQKYDPTKKDKDGNQVSFERYMANTGMQRLNALATKLGVESVEQGVTESLDSPQAKQVADTTTEVETALDTKPIIDVMNFAKKADPSINVKQFEQDFTQGVEALAKEKGIDITNPNLTPKQLQAITPYNVLAKAIGIPANKLSNAADNLSKSESLKAQRILLAAKPFIKNVVLGQANKQVQTVASKKKGGKPVKIGGESLGLGRNILNTFFNPPKRVGNNLVRTPKKFDNKVYDGSIGIKDGKVDPNYVPRASESQTIKGLLKGVAEQMANRGARNILDTKTQTSNVVAAKANLERGKSKLMFSLAKPINKQVSEYKNRMKPQDKFLRGKDGKKVLGGKQNQTIKNRIKNKIVPELKNILTPKEKVVLLYTMQGTGASKTNPNFGRSGMIYPNSTQAMEALGITKDQVKELNKSPELQLALRYAGKAVLSTSGLSLDKINEIKNNKSTQGLIAKENEAKKNILFDIIKKITNLVANKPKLANGINHVLGLQSDYQGHFIRKLIPFVSFTDTKFLEDGIHDEHYSKSLRTTRFVQSMVDQAAARGQEYINKELIDDLNDLWTGMGRGIVSKIEGNKFDEKKGIGEQQYIAQSPMIEVLGKVQDAKNHFVLPFTEANPSSELKTLEEVGEVIKNKEFLDQKKLNAENTIQKGQDALAKNPNLKPSLPDPVKLDTEINTMIQETKGIEAKKRYSDIVAKRRGAGVKNFKLIPSGAQDFNGLMYDLYAKGKKGEAQQKWVKENLTKPYQDGIAKIDKYRQALKNDYATLLKQNPNVAKKLGKIVPGTEFTLDQALRVNLWTQGGFEIPGLSKRDIKKLNDIVNKDPELKLFNESALAITKQPKWVAPSPHWDVESLISDLNSLTTKVGRKQFLEEFIANKNAIFSNENLNKMEVALGTNWREAMEDSLYRMENGTNRPSGTNRLTNNFLNWVNNSVGAIMFMNVKSALLQTISSVNFLNWSDNNPFKAALALANFPQYVKDFTFLWNSPKLVQRRSGLRKDINEAELANAAQGAKNKPAAMLSYLLKLGFTPTQLADSFAIASGGATFYRNRLETYKKQGLSEQEASDKAFEDFAEASDVAQQSADPMLISQQQAGVLGRLLLAFQNTPAQVTRIFNKASRDFINGRGDQKTNVSKMIYYGAVQGFIFAALQNALFAMIPGFDDEDDEEKKASNLNKKEERIVNSMVDTLLRGSGVYGAIVATLKNTALTYFREEKKGPFSKDHRNTLVEIMNLSPPVGSKLRKVNNAIKAKEYNEEVVEEQGWDVTLKGKVNLSPSYQVLASLTEAFTNLPLERMVIEIDRIVETLDARNTTFQRVALALGYRTWDVGSKNEERDLVKIEVKARKKQEKKEAKEKEKERLRKLEEERKYLGKTEEEIKIIKQKDSIFDTNKSDQIISLTNLGLTKKEIRELKLEEDRVDKIIELTKKK